VIGGGAIGAEFASVYTDFGVQTTLLERFHTACCRLARTATPLTSSRKLLPSAARTFTRRPAWVLFEPQLARLLESWLYAPRRSK
jgi:Pyridine nucleotide-disulphide oxidoreductase